MGVCLEAAVHIVTASSTTIQNVNTCINRADLLVDCIMLKTIAVTKAVAASDEEELGSIIIDLGAGSTDFLILLKGAPVYTASIPIGGNIVTNDIAIVKGISVAEAEHIKIEAGVCWNGCVQQGNRVIIGGLGGGRPPEEIEQQELCDIISPRIEEIFRMIRAEIIRKTTITDLFGNIILTGGGAKMDGVIEVAQEVFDVDAVRIGRPKKLGGIEEDYEGPEWATAVGLILSAENESGSSNIKRKPPALDNKRGDNIFKKILKSLF